MRSEVGVTINLQPQEQSPLYSSSLLSSSPREASPVAFAFMHLSKEAKRQYPRGLKLLFDYLKILPAGGGSGSGTGVTVFSTNSTGQLAFLDNTVAIAQVEYSPKEGINRFREWEWKGGAVPFQTGSGGATTGNQSTITSALEEEE